MWRGIVFNSIYHCLVLTIVLFKGDEIFDVKHFADNEFDVWSQENGEHLSIFFNIFVFLQVFNFFNARKLKKDELNVFSNFFINYLFIVIVIGIFLLQLFIVQFGGATFQLVPLSTSQHIQCILIGASGLVWNVIVKVFIPDSFMNNFNLLRENEKNEIVNVDSIFERWEKQPATERRKSKMRKSRTEV
jgi:magnesium-transporting ATPase (P-type)